MFVPAAEVKEKEELLEKKVADAEAKEAAFFAGES